MSYPEPTYHGTAGEVTATHRDAAAPADFTYPNGTRVHYLATGASTDDRFGLYRWEMVAGAGGPGPHFHRTFSESFYVLSGTVQVYDGAEWRDCAAGAFVHVPEGGIHAFRGGDEPATMLIHFAPGAPREAYFEGGPAMAEATDEEKAEFYRLHDNTWI